ncbi:MAG: hypothetical protein ACLSAH_11150 [Bilophila wadsworthia]
MIRKQRRGEQDGDAAGGEEDTLGPPDPRHDDPTSDGRPPRRGPCRKDAAAVPLSRP